MSQHYWKAIPYDESYVGGYHRQFAPYAWRCQHCNTCCRTTSEDYPSPQNMGLRGCEFSPLDIECLPDSL